MAAYIINNHITEPEKLTNFDSDGYRFIEQSTLKKQRNTTIIPSECSLVLISSL